jgi:hypothetical protein
MHENRQPVNFQTVRLERGAHRSPEDGACVMELASMIAGEEFSDHPMCASPVVAALLRSLNDAVGGNRREELRHYASAVVGSRGSEALERARAQRCVDWARDRSRVCGLRRFSLGARFARDRDPRKRFERAIQPHVLRAWRGGFGPVYELVDELLAMRESPTPARVSPPAESALPVLSRV